MLCFIGLSLILPTLPSDRQRLQLKGAVKEVRRLSEDGSRPGGRQGSSRLKATQTYGFDRAGFLSREIFFDDGFEWQICSISYDQSMSRISSVIEKDTSSLSSTPRLRAATGSSPTQRTLPTILKDVFKLDSKGRVADETQYESNGDRVRTQRFSYDVGGRVSKYRWVDESGKEYGGEEYWYYPAGELKELVSDGEINVRYTDYKFDKVGNWVQRARERINYAVDRPEGGQRPFMPRAIEYQVIMYY